MVGVTVWTLGREELFESLDHGGPIDVTVMVIGYVVMGLPMVVLWSLAAHHDPERAPAAYRYIRTISLAQAGWLTLVLLHLPLWAFVVAGAPLLALELLGPVLAERRRPTPWNARHIAERHGPLLLEAGLFAVAGIGLTVGLWWMYFVVPWGDVLAQHRDRSTLWGLGHLLLFGSIAATGAGLHVAAYFLEDMTKLGLRQRS
jgi:low temperature requirement protein LtrA